MLDIIYQDEYLVAINKPAGLLVHRSDIDRHETRFAVQLLRNQIRQHVFPVHRLDKPTAGVLLFGLDSGTAGLLTESFRRHEIYKEYVAVVRGHTEPSGHISHAITRQLDGIADDSASREKPAQDAMTDFTTIAKTELPVAVGRYATARYSFVKLMPQTGRKHQLRRHMKHISHQIIGDTTHGDGRHNLMFRERFDCHRLLLAATQLHIEHPYNGRKLELCADLDVDYARVLRLIDLPLYHSRPGRLAER